MLDSAFPDPAIFLNRSFIFVLDLHEVQQRLSLERVQTLWSERYKLFPIQSLQTWLYNMNNKCLMSSEYKFPIFPQYKRSQPMWFTELSLFCSCPYSFLFPQFLLSPLHIPTLYLPHRVFAAMPLFHIKNHVVILYLLSQTFISALVEGNLLLSNNNCKMPSINYSWPGARSLCTLKGN